MFGRLYFTATAKEAFGKNTVSWRVLAYREARRVITYVFCGNRPRKCSSASSARALKEPCMSIIAYLYNATPMKSLSCYFKPYSNVRRLSHMSSIMYAISISTLHAHRALNAANAVEADVMAAMWLA